MNTTLPVIRINEPCPMDWSAMAPVDAGGTVRHCSVCDFNVHDLSAMTDAEAQRFLVKAAAGHLCGRMTVKRDGTLLTRDTEKTANGATKWLAVVALGASLAGGTGSTLADEDVAPAVEAKGEMVVMMGKVAPARVVEPVAFTPQRPADLLHATNLLGQPIEQLPEWAHKLAKTLPAGVMPLQRGDASYPAGLVAAPGTVYLFGDAGKDGQPDTVRLVVWQMPAGYVDANPVTPETMPSVHRVVARNAEGDFLTWSDTAGSELIDKAASVFNDPATRPSGDEPVRENGGVKIE